VAGSNNNVTLSNGTEYLGYGESGTNFVKNSKTEWSVAEDGDNVFRFTNATSSGRGIAYQYDNNGTPSSRFGAYATSNAGANTGYVFELMVFKLGEVSPDQAGLSTPEEIVNALYALEKGESLDRSYSLTGVITEIGEAYSSQYKNITLTMQVGDMTDKPIVCYRLKGEGADAIAVGDTITVSGILTNYNGTYEFTSGCTLDSYVDNTTGSEDSEEPESSETPTYTTPEEIVNAAYALEEGGTLAGGPYTLTGVITEVGTPYSDQFKNVTVTIKVGNMTEKQIVCYRLKGDGADKLAVGDTVTVKGSLINFYGEVQFNQGCTIESYVDNTPDDTTSEPASSEKPDDTTSEPEESEEPEAPVLTTPEEIVNAAYALKDGESLKGTYELKGVITSIDTPYDSGYKNLTVTIQVGDMKDKLIKCYRLKGDGADKLAVGDTILVSGVLKNYKGTIEFDAGCVLVDDSEPLYTTPEEIVNAAYALEEGKSLSRVYSLTGKITSIDAAYDAGYNNITVTIQVGDMTEKKIVCFRMKGDGADKLAVGDKITVTGSLTNYNGTIEFNAGCTFVVAKETPNKPVTPEKGDMGSVAMYMMLLAGCALVTVGVISKKKMA